MGTFASSSRTQFAVPNLARLWANGNFGTDRSDAIAIGILKRNMNIAVCFDFCVNNAPTERVPFLLRRQSFFRRARQIHTRPEPFHA